MDILWEATGMDIERESMRRIEAEAPAEARARFSPAEWLIARRLVHTTADFSILNALEFRHDPIVAGLAALRRGAQIYADSNMIKSGISVAKLQKLNAAYTRESILAPLADTAVAAYAEAHGITRALAAVTLHAPALNGAIFLCGNAPLALAGMTRLALEQNIRPALVIAMPVGFVNVVESKEYAKSLELPLIILNGRRGGSPLAVATLHGLLEGVL